MRERDELSEGLLRAAAGANPAASDANADRQAEVVLRRDDKRLRRLTIATVALWAVAVLMLVLLVAAYYLFVVPKLQHDADDNGQRLHSVVLYVIGTGSALVGVAVVILALASMTTLLLVSASRRSTLRQLTAGLADVSASLAQIRKELAERPGGR